MPDDATNERTDSRPPRRDYGVHALVAHVLLAAASVQVIVAYVPVVAGETSGEGAGMGIALLAIFLGAPLALVATVAAVASLHTRKVELLVPTALLLAGVPVAVALRSELALVVDLGLYVAAVLGAIVLRARRQVRPPGSHATERREARTVGKRR